MDEVRPEDRPGSGRSAEQQRESLLVVVEPDAVIDRCESSAIAEVRCRVGRAVVADDKCMGIPVCRAAPLAEAVVAAGGSRKTFRVSEDVDRAGFAVVAGEDRGARALARGKRMPCRGE